MRHPVIAGPAARPSRTGLRLRCLARRGILAAGLVAAGLLAALPAVAACLGTNLIAALPLPERSALYDAARAVPFSSGNFWDLRRGADERVIVVGTYHFDDPRHAATMEWLDPVIAGAARVLVEAGPEEQAALMARITSEPALLLSDGPTLPEQLSKADWQALSQALRNRGVPPLMASRFRPWYISAVLAIPPCAAAEAAVASGLDGAVIAAAQTHGVPLQALEPYDTLFGLFEGMSQADQLAFIRTALATEGQSADLAVTLADSYFEGESRLIWEFSRAQARALPGFTPEMLDAAFAQMEETLVNARNRAWIPVITEAASSGLVVAAFGALHLPGKAGVLALLQEQGFTVAPLFP
jgi:uncharacterized protein